MGSPGRKRHDGVASVCSADYLYSTQKELGHRSTSVVELVLIRVFDVPVLVLRQPAFEIYYLFAFLLHHGFNSEELLCAAQLWYDCVLCSFDLQRPASILSWAQLRTLHNNWESAQHLRQYHSERAICQCTIRDQIRQREGTRLSVLYAVPSTSCVVVEPEAPAHLW